MTNRHRDNPSPRDAAAAPAKKPKPKPRTAVVYRQDGNWYTEFDYGQKPDHFREKLEAKDEEEARTKAASVAGVAREHVLILDGPPTGEGQPGR